MAILAPMLKMRTAAVASRRNFGRMSSATDKFVALGNAMKDLFIFGTSD